LSYLDDDDDDDEEEDEEDAEGTYSPADCLVRPFENYWLAIRYDQPLCSFWTEDEAYAWLAGWMVYNGFTVPVWCIEYDGSMMQVEMDELIADAKAAR